MIEAETPMGVSKVTAMAAGATRESTYFGDVIPAIGYNLQPTELSSEGPLKSLARSWPPNMEEKVTADPGTARILAV
jgi:hypothetical protein